MESVLKLFALTVQDVQMIPWGALFFVVLWQALSRILFKPYLALIEAREAATSGAVETSRDKLAKAAELRSAYAERLNGARVDAMKGKIEKVAAAKKEGAQVVEKAELAAQDALKQGRADIARDARTLKDQSLRDADALAEMIIEKIKTGAGSNRPGVQ